MFGLSPEQSKFQRSSLCPRCGRLTLPRYRSSAGVSISRFTPFPLMDKSAIAQCPSCEQTWAVFGDGQPSAPAPPAGGVELVETGRSEEGWFDDERVLDNLGSSSTAHQTISVSEQWRQTIQLDRERARTSGGGGSLDIGGIASIEAKAEQTLRETYSLTEDRQRSFTAELTIEVPPRTLRHLVLRYRHIFQDGVARLPQSDGSTVEIPFRVALNVTLDWSQRDEAS